MPIQVDCEVINEDRRRLLSTAVMETAAAGALTIFPGEIHGAPRSWAGQSYKKLISWDEVVQVAPAADVKTFGAAMREPTLFKRGNVNRNPEGDIHP